MWFLLDIELHLLVKGVIRGSRTHHFLTPQGNWKDCPDEEWIFVLFSSSLWSHSWANLHLQLYCHQYMCGLVEEEGRGGITDRQISPLSSQLPPPPHVPLSTFTSGSLCSSRVQTDELHSHSRRLFTTQHTLSTAAPRPASGWEKMETDQLNEL